MTSLQGRGALELDAHHIPPVRWIGNPSLDTLCENRRRLGPARQGFPIRHPKPGASSWGERLAGPGHQIRPARPRCEKKREAQSDTTSQQRSTWDKSYDALEPEPTTPKTFAINSSRDMLEKLKREIEQL